MASYLPNVPVMSKGGPHSKVPTDVILDYDRLEQDFARARKGGPEELGRFVALCRHQRQEWEKYGQDLEGLDWTEIARQAQAGKNLTGKLKTMAAEVSTEAEEAADHIKGWKQRIPGGASELACEAIRATSKGQENAPDKLDQWQWTAKAQATNAVEALKDFEAKAERERRDGQAKDLR